MQPEHCWANIKFELKGYCSNWIQIFDTNSVVYSSYFCRCWDLVSDGAKLFCHCQVPVLEGAKHISFSQFSCEKLICFAPSKAILGFLDCATTSIIHSLRVGWRNFFSSCAVVSVFGSGGKYIFVLFTMYLCT